MNQLFYDTVREAFLKRTLPSFEYKQFNIQPQSILLDKESITQHTLSENNSLKDLNTYYENNIRPLFTKYIPSSYRLHEITNGYNDYYNKYLAVLAYVLAKQERMKNPEIPALIIAQFFSLFFVVDDFWDQSTERFGRPCYWVKYGKEKTLSDVHIVINDLEHALLTNGVTDADSIIQSFRDTVDIWSTIYKQDYAQEKPFTHCVNRWYLMNKILFTAFSLYKNQRVFDVFTSFSLGTHVLNDLKDLQSKNEDIVSGQYSFALSYFIESTQVETANEFLEIIGKSKASDYVEKYIKISKEIKTDEQISALSVTLLQEHQTMVNDILSDKGSISAIDKWLSARMGRILNGGYLLDEFSAELSKSLGSKDRLVSKA